MLYAKLRGHVIYDTEWDGLHLTQGDLTNGERLEMPAIDTFSVADARAMVATLTQE